MNRIYIAGIDEIPQRCTLEDNDLLKVTIVCPPGYSSDINFAIDLLLLGVKLDLAGLYFCTRGERQNFNITVRDARLSNGAGFVVVYTGDIMTMPGLPKVPAAEKIDVDADGKITGLF